VEVEVDGTPVPNKPMVSVNVKQHFNIIPGQPKISGPTVEKLLSKDQENRHTALQDTPAQF